ncbi:50S ribosomal protein L28 [endosymbiont of Acanthamoeba sp. UWC8]|uniref:50S ribosomal protein L28 n=1 Tax=Candidatus Jidaibacter acanthamoebae TaxID=86105 RepID=UPI0004D1F7CC|nr:50S ribosomal protein L28 [Candidatus Jidaibacter acanthamoeba]AIF80910.1 50S ribosomal protein L28 [endosymbiont of Acanthamoeba sp. UWC8]
MSRRCELNLEKAVMSGNNVSHSNRKTRRRFLPNIQTFSLLSDALGTFIRFDAAPSTIRSVEHNNGVDNYLLKASPSNLGKKAKALRKKIIEVLKAKQAG